jgi:elongation factor Ts
VRFRSPGAGLIGTYVHFNHKVGSMVQIDASDETVAQAPAVKQAALDIAMHVTASKPLALDKDSLDPDVVAKERTIYAEQVQNKPPEIVEKIVDGKMRKFYAENCLLEQPFVKDDSRTIKQVIEGAAKEAGGQAAIRQFARLAVG